MTSPRHHQNFRIDINADLGEQPEEMTRDIALMQMISSANIACGGHAGDADSMAAMVKAAIAAGIAIGAHPSYPDRENFGRTSLTMADDDFRATLLEQVNALNSIASGLNAEISHIKPHGALYNDLARDAALAETYCVLHKEYWPDIALMGLAHSEIAEQAEKQGIKFIAEAFIDRAYARQNALVPRGQKGAVIENNEGRWAQAQSIICDRLISLADGGMVKVAADSLCLHSDSPGALETAQYIASQCRKNHIAIGAPHG